MFKLKANLEFDAKDIDDAFKKLSKHFQDLHRGNPSHFISSGTISIIPKKNRRKNEPK